MEQFLYRMYKSLVNSKYSGWLTLPLSWSRVRLPHTETVELETNPKLKLEELSWPNVKRTLLCEKGRDWTRQRILLPNCIY